MGEKDMLNLSTLTPLQKRQCSRCGASWDYPNITNCKRCHERELERARRRNNNAEKEKKAELKHEKEEYRATHCYACGILLDEPNPNCRLCCYRARRKKWILHRDKVMTPRDMQNLKTTKAWIRARRARLGQDLDAPIEGIDY